MQTRRDGKRIYYSLTGKDVAQLGVTLRQVAEEHLIELRMALQGMMADPERMAELPRDVQIVAYCRGPFCLMSDEAVKLLQAHGYQARKTFDGVSEWQAAGLPIAKN